mgnify:FL=1
MYVKSQKFLVLGVSKSGCSAAGSILSHGGTCYLYEELKSDKISSSIAKLCSLGAVNVTGKVEEYIDKIDVLVISPGVPINHPVAVMAKKAGKRIMGELEFGYLSLCPVVIGVTGTNGKTTTVNMISNILKEAAVKHHLCGNVGVPITTVAESLEKGDVLVAEVSSFQLESTQFFAPHIACVLNVSPDHLERHYTMDNYVFLKKRLLKNSSESEYAVLNYDDEKVREFADGLKSNVIWVSVKEPVNGAYCLNGEIYYKNEKIMPASELPTVGEHNVYNALFGVAVAKLMSVNTEYIKNGLISFKGVKHRIELVGEKNGVKFYDDSKATNTASTITALNSVNSPVILILGGSEKGEKYDLLFKEIKKKHVKHVIITGASKLNMLSAANEAGMSDVTVTPDFYNAVKISYMLAESGDNVLLSPACASFDCFKNYEERGVAFCKIVDGFI